jgi:hypothetical protein
MSSNFAKTSAKKVIKPLNPTDFVNDNMKFSNVKNNTEIGTKWVDTTYAKTAGNEDRMLVVARGCIIKTFKKMENKDKNGKEFINKDGTSRKDKYQIFMGLKDDKFIEMVKEYEEFLVNKGMENSVAWFDEQFNEEECREMLKPLLSEHEKYGCAIGGILGRDFTCKSKSEDVPDVSDLIIALAKGTLIDVCFWFNKIKLGAGKYSIGMEINQINIISVGSGGEYEPSGIKPDEYTSGKVTLTEQQQHEKGGKFCKVLYEDKPMRFNLENVTGRIFKFEKDGQVSYSMSIRLADKTLRKMVEGLDQEIFDLLVENSKVYFGAKKTPKLLKAIVKPIYSYNKNDQEKIKKGEKPSYDPSIWIKIYYSSDKGFDGKIVNVENGKPILNTEELINKDLTISRMDAYSRHIWFGPKGTSINLTLNKCAISYETTEYDMDDVDNASVDEEEEKKDESADSEEEVVNTIRKTNTTKNTKNSNKQIIADEEADNSD